MMSDEQRDEGVAKAAETFHEFLSRGGATQRYHTEQLIKPQNIAAHSFGVAWYCWFLSARNPSANLLMAALAHDMAEQVTGDMPSPAKRKLGIGAEFAAMEAEVMMVYGVPDFEALLTEDEKITLKRADVLDGMAKCLAERQLGNRGLQKVYMNFVKYYAQLPECELGDQLLSVIGEQYDQCS